MRPSKFDILVGDLENMIASRDLAGGSQLPSQSQIVKKFKVSRSCAHKALNLLHTKGLITAGVGGANYNFLVAFRHDGKSNYWCKDGSAKTTQLGNGFGTDPLWHSYASGAQAGKYYQNGNYVY
jgi:DNA-binding transcriptional MocR family regulator